MKRPRSESPDPIGGPPVHPEDPGDRQVLGESPGDAEQARTILTGLLRIAPSDLTPEDLARYHLATARVLEDAFESTGQWTHLAQLWEMLLQVRLPGACRADLYEKLLGLYEGPLGNSAVAFGLAARAFAELHEDPIWQVKLEDLALRGQRFEELTCVYLDLAERQGSSPLACQLRKRAAEIQEGHLENRVEAIDQYENLVRDGNADGETLKALCQLYRKGGDLLKQKGLLTRLAEQAETIEEKKEYLFELVHCLARQGNEAEAMIQVYWDILKLDPDNLTALTALDALLNAEKRFGQQIKVLERQIGVHQYQSERQTNQRSLKTLFVRIADLIQNQLGNPEAALFYLRSAVPLAHDAFEVVHLLEPFLSTTEELRFAAAQNLEPIYRQSQQHEKLAAVLSILLTGDGPFAAQKAHFQELIRLHDEALVQNPMAFLVEPIRARLIQLAREYELTDPLAEMFDQWLSGITDPVLRLQALRERAGLEEMRGADRDQSIARWVRVLEADAEDREALQALRRLYQEGERLTELADVVHRLIKLEDDSEHKKDLFFELAHLLEEPLGRLSEAIDVYLQILTFDPQDRSARKLLNRLYLLNAPG